MYTRVLINTTQEVATSKEFCDLQEYLAIVASAMLCDEHNTMSVQVDQTIMYTHSVQYLAFNKVSADTDPVHIFRKEGRSNLTIKIKHLQDVSDDLEARLAKACVAVAYAILPESLVLKPICWVKGAHQKDEKWCTYDPLTHKRGAVSGWLRDLKAGRISFFEARTAFDCLLE